MNKTAPPASPTFPEVLLQEQNILEEALDCLGAGNNANAQTLLASLVDAGSVRPEPYHMLALLHEANGDLPTATKLLQTAADLDFSSTNCLRDLVRLHVALHEYGKALGYLGLIIQRDGQDELLADTAMQILARMPAGPASLDWLSPDIPSMRKTLDELRNRCRDLEARQVIQPVPPPQSKPPRPAAVFQETDKRLAFLIFGEELLNHVRNICRHLPSSSFVFLVHADGSEAQAIEEAVRREGWLALRTADVLAEGRRFRALVSNHPHTLSDPPLITRLADTNIRLMYAAGKSGWNLRDWNRLYDIILCFGPYHAERFQAVSEAQIVQMGYPRFDTFFDSGFDRAAALQRFSCDPKKKTVVWLPTWGTLTSVGLWDKAIASLTGQFNVLIKVHPLMPVMEPGKVDALETLGFNRVIRDATDNMPLFQLADFVLCDYGGSPFGAIYTDRNLLLLDVAVDAEKDELVGADSTETLIRKSIPVLQPGDAHRLSDMLADEKLWADQAQARAKLRRLFFAPYYGFASQIAAATLANLDAVVRHKEDKRPW